MSPLLAEAIAQLHLKPGETYRMTVNGHVVDIRMYGTPSFPLGQEVVSQFADMTMLQPWFDMPEPPGALTFHACPGPIDLPDMPSIPPDDEAEA